MRHWCIEQSFGLCGRGRGWDYLGEWHWNMYNIIYETSRQSRFDARYWMLGAGALGRPRGMVWGGRWEEGSGWGTCVCLWQIHFIIWRNQYNTVKFKNKVKLKKNKYSKKKKKLYPKEKKRKQSNMKLNLLSEFFHTVLYPNCSGCMVVWHWGERCYQKGENFLGLAKKFFWFF